jgi:hypothetical protein
MKFAEEECTTSAAKAELTNKALTAALEARIAVRLGVRDYVAFAGLARA